jgi:hypothetical protein
MLIAVFAWLLLTWGLTYIVSRAEVTEPLRVWFVSRLPLKITPLAAYLLSCRICFGFWSGTAAAAAVMGVFSGIGGRFPWHLWLYLPIIAGVCSVGAIDLLAYTTRGGKRVQHDE